VGAEKGRGDVVECDQFGEGVRYGCCVVAVTPRGNRCGVVQAKSANCAVLTV
jgi:hypothetical protein